jgi:hypothetical protein
MSAVRQPSSRSRPTKVVALIGRERSLKITPWAEGMRPVMIVDRFGMQTGLFT